MCKKFVLLSLLMWIISFSLYSEGSAKIIFVSGGNFSIVRNETRLDYTIDDHVIDMPVYQGDTLLTETGTLVEVQLEVSGTVIFIAENTTLLFENLDKSGNGLIQLSYGRVRAIVNQKTESSEFYIQGHDTIAGVRGADFGFDLLFDRTGKDPEKRAVVYSFSGTAGILKKNYDDERNQFNKMSGEENTLMISSNQMVQSSSLYPDQDLTIEPVSSEIIEFWKNTPLVAVENPENSNLLNSEILNNTDENIQDLYLGKYSKKQRLQMTGAYTFGAGAAAITAGVLIYMFAPESRTAGQAVTGFGAGVTTIGLSFFISSLFFDDDGNPKFKNKEKD